MGNIHSTIGKVEKINKTKEREGEKEKREREKIGALY